MLLRVVANFSTRRNKNSYVKQFRFNASSVVQQFNLSTFTFQHSSFNFLYPSLLSLPSILSLLSLLVRLSTFNVLYSLYFFVSHRNLTNLTENASYTRVCRPDGSFTVHHSPFIVLYFLYFLYSLYSFTIHRSSFFTLSTLFTSLS